MRRPERFYYEWVLSELVFCFCFLRWQYGIFNSGNGVYHTAHVLMLQCSYIHRMKPVSWEGQRVQHSAIPVARGSGKLSGSLHVLPSTWPGAKLPAFPTVYFQRKQPSFAKGPKLAKLGPSDAPTFSGLCWPKKLHAQKGKNETDILLRDRKEAWAVSSLDEWSSTAAWRRVTGRENTAENKSNGEPEKGCLYRMQAATFPSILQTTKHIKQQKSANIYTVENNPEVTAVPRRHIKLHLNVCRPQGCEWCISHLRVTQGCAQSWSQTATMPATEEPSEQTDSPSAFCLGATLTPTRPWPANSSLLQGIS